MQAGMDRERYQHVKRIFLAAVQKGGPERAAFLDDACGDDPELRRQMGILLETSDLDAGWPSAHTLETLLGDMSLTGADTLVPGTAAGPAPLQPDSVIRHYRVLAKVGEGGMGSVWKALDTSLEREVAIKLLPSHWAADPDHLARFRREARLVASINHPNIVVIHAIEDRADPPFMVMEFVDGKPLRRCIPEGGFSPGALLDHAIPVADALAATHDRGVTHHDLKPENIMVTSEGRIKVLDFGIASGPGVREGEDGPPAVRGTLPYMSPEQLRGEETDARSDVFTLGVVLYEMAVGHRPFGGETAVDLVASILRDDPPAPSGVRAGLPARFDALVAECLAKDPADRPPTARPVLQHLLALRSELERAALLALTRPSRGARASRSLRGALPERIAVLPFQDLSPGEDQGFFCHGISEDITAALSRIDGLGVTLASRMDRRSITPGDMGRMLGADAILDGSVRRMDDVLRITVRITSVADGSRLWTRRFDRPPQDAFAVQDEVAREVADHFDAALSPGRVRRADPEAYAAYMRGRYFWGKRYEGGLQRALECFAEALAVDPGMPAAHAGRADCFIILGHYGFMDPRKAYPEAERSARKALESDPQLAEACASMGWIDGFYHRRWDEGEKWFRRSIEIDPNYATAREWFGIHLVARGRREEAMHSMREARRLDPLSMMVNTILGWACFETGSEEEGFRILHSVLEMDPRFVFAHNVLGLTLAIIRRMDEAIPELEQAVLLSGRERLSLAFLGYGYGRAGRRAEAEAVIEELAASSEGRFGSALHRAMPELGLGRLDRATGHLEQAVATGDTFFTTFHFSRIFGPLREHPGFRALTGELGLAG